MIGVGIRELSSPIWQPIETAPVRPMVVLFYSQNCVWHDQHGNVAPEWPPERDEKYSLGFWDGDWFWMGTAHRVFEIDPIGHPDQPSHWSPVLPPPVSSGRTLADATNNPVPLTLSDAGSDAEGRARKTCCDSEGQPCSRCLEAALAYTRKDKTDGE